MQGLVEGILQIVGTFGTGFYVAISPCLFPLLPMVLIRSLQSENSRYRSGLVTLSLVAGIMTSLVVFAFISSIIGLFLIQYHSIIQAVLGAIIAFLGLVMIVERLREVLRLTSLTLVSHPTSPTGLLNVFTIGLTYSLLAAPCSAPSLIGVFLIFGTQLNPLMLLAMFVALSLGVAIPYLAIGLATGEARQRIASGLARNARRIEIAVGVFLVALGVILMLPAFGISIGI
ncbi:MAG: hypothetical protein EAX95_13235 [Candidatus Thorarchaeota archaeon]|nr:hypothetical protein [Candidatus Thorarchaeota archaeon]